MYSIPMRPMRVLCIHIYPSVVVAPLAQVPAIQQYKVHTREIQTTGQTQRVNVPIIVFRQKIYSRFLRERTINKNCARILYFAIRYSQFAVRIYTKSANEADRDPAINNGAIGMRRWETRRRRKRRWRRRVEYTFMRTATQGYLLLFVRTNEQAGIAKDQFMRLFLICYFFVFAAFFICFVCFFLYFCIRPRVFVVFGSTKWGLKLEILFCCRCATHDVLNLLNASQRWTKMEPCHCRVHVFQSLGILYKVFAFFCTYNLLLLLISHATNKQMDLKESVENCSWMVV